MPRALLLLVPLLVACASARGPAPELLARGKTLLAEGKPARAVACFRAIERDHEKSAEEEEGLFLLAEAHRKARHGERSFQSYKKFLEKFPASRFAVPAANGLYALGDDYLEGRIPGFFILPPDRGFGVPVLEHMQATFRNHSLADDALVRVGRFRMEEGDWNDAAEVWKRLLSEYPRSDYFLLAEYELARSLWLQVQGPHYDERLALQALRTYRDFVENVARLPGGARGREKTVAAAERAIGKIREMLAEKQVLIARFYERTKRPRSALHYYRYCAAEYAGTAAAGEADRRLRELEKEISAGPAAPVGAAAGEGRA